MCPQWALDVSLSWSSGRVSEASLVKERMLKLSEELLRLDETWVQERIDSMSAFAARLKNWNLVSLDHLEARKPVYSCLAMVGSRTLEEYDNDNEETNGMKSQVALYSFF